MTRNFVATLIAAVLLVAIAAPVFAHHSESAEYDASKPVKITGTIKKVEWMNPHIWFYVDVKDKDGKVTNWEFELGSPNGLMRNGWTRSSMKPGDVVEIDGFLAKDGSALANARNVKLADGKKLFAGSANDDAPK